MPFVKRGASSTVPGTVPSEMQVKALAEMQVKVSVTVPAEMPVKVSGKVPGAVQVKVQAGAPGLWERQKGIDMMLEGFQKFCDMITVCGSVMACYGKGHPGTFSLYEKFPGFKRRKIVGRTAIGMDGKMLEGNPWNAGYRVCIFRWLLWTLG